MTVKLNIVSKWDASGVRAANAAMANFEKTYKVSSDSVAATIAEQSIATQQLGQKWQDAGAKMTAVGMGLTKGVTIPLAATGVAAFKAASDMESAFANVRKTVDATEAEYQRLYDAAISMSKVHAVSADDVAIIMSLGAQLGIATENLGGFAEVVYGMDLATDLDAETAATQMAQFANITGMAQADMERLGSTVVEMGNTSATTESKIMALSSRLAAAGTQVGMTEPEIVGLAAAMSSLGIEAEAGGTALSTVISNIDKQVATNGANLETWAQTAGMSASEFAAAWQSDVTGTLEKVIVGMANTTEEGSNLSVLLDELGVTSLRQTDAMKRLAGNSDLLTDSIKNANAAWDENIALENEVANFEDTTASKLQIVKNKVQDVAIEAGGPLLDAVSDLIDDADPFIDMLTNAAEGFTNLDKGTQQAIIRTAAMVAAIGPLITIGGKLTTGVGKIITSYGKAEAALARYVAKTGEAAVSSKVFTAALEKGVPAVGKFGAAIAAIAIADFAAKMVIAKKDIDITSAFNDNLEAARKFGEQLTNIQPQFTDFSDTVSASGSTLSELDDVISSAESNITAILQTALSEQQGLRDDDVAKIREYEDQIAAAYAEQTTTLIGVLDGRAQAIASKKDELTAAEAAQERANIDTIAEEAYAGLEEWKNTELGIIEARHRAAGTIGTDAYNQEIADLQAHYDQKVAEVEAGENKAYSAVASKMADTTAAVAEGWAKVAEYAESGEKKNHTSLGIWLADMTEWTATAKKRQDEYIEMLNTMDMENTQAFLNMAATTVSSGQDLTAANKQLVLDILDSYDDLPDQYSGIAQESLLAMISGMESQWPWVAEASSMTADQIVEHIAEELGMTGLIGSEYGANFASGVDSQQGAAETAGGNVAKKAVDGTEEKASKKKGNSLGDNFGSGFVAGILNWLSPAWTAGYDLSSNAVKGAARGQDSRSPSKKTKKLGQDFDAGYIGGIEEDAYLAIRAAESLAEDTVNALATDSRGGYQMAAAGATATQRGTGGAIVYNVTFNGGINVQAKDIKEAKDTADVLEVLFAASGLGAEIAQ